MEQRENPKCYKWTDDSVQCKESNKSFICSTNKENGVDYDKYECDMTTGICKPTAKNTLAKYYCNSEFNSTGNYKWHGNSCYFDSILFIFIVSPYIDLMGMIRDAEGRKNDSESERIRIELLNEFKKLLQTISKGEDCTMDTGNFRIKIVGYCKILQNENIVDKDLCKNIFNNSFSEVADLYKVFVSMLNYNIEAWYVSNDKKNDPPTDNEKIGLIIEYYEEDFVLIVNNPAPKLIAMSTIDENRKAQSIENVNMLLHTMIDEKDVAFGAIGFCTWVDELKHHTSLIKMTNGLWKHIDVYRGINDDIEITIEENKIKSVQENDHI